MMGEGLSLRNQLVIFIDVGRPSRLTFLTVKPLASQSSRCLRCSQNRKHRTR